MRLLATCRIWKVAYQNVLHVYSHLKRAIYNTTFEKKIFSTENGHPQDTWVSTLPAWLTGLTRIQRCGASYLHVSHQTSMKVSYIYLSCLPALDEMLSVFQARFCSFEWRILTFLCHLGFQPGVCQGSESLKLRVLHPPCHFETQSGPQPLDLEVSLVT